METVLVDHWLPTRGADAVDPELLARLGLALFEERGRLRRSIRIEPRDGLDWVGEYVSLVDALDAHAGLIAGWWRGIAGRAADALGEPQAEVPLAPGSDLDLVVWRVAAGELIAVLHAVGEAPTVLVTPDLGWVLVSPPASDDKFLYPEVSASDQSAQASPAW